MSREKGESYFAILVTAAVLLPTLAMAGGLSISVVDDRKQGVSSDIYSEGSTTEIIIGRTKQDGTMLVPSYKCSYDKPLLAKPIDGSYFNSNQEPCKTPLNFLVRSRMTPKGTTAFSQIWRNVKFPDGSDGQIDYMVAMNIYKHTIPRPGGEFKAGLEEEACKLDYNIEGYGSIAKLAADGWKNVSQPREPATNIFNFDRKTVSQLFQNKPLHAETNDQGITLFVPGDCSKVTTATTEGFATVIKEAVDQKVKAGEYKELEDLSQFKDLK